MQPVDVLASLANWKGTAPAASEQDITSVEAAIGVSIPADYVVVLKVWNGGGLLLGSGTYLHLLGTAEMLQDARYLRIIMDAFRQPGEFLPQLLPFASWGTGDLAAFNTHGLVVDCDHESHFKEWNVVANSFSEWFKQALTGKFFGS